MAKRADYTLLIVLVVVAIAVALYFLLKEEKKDAIQRSGQALVINEPKDNLFSTISALGQVIFPPLLNSNSGTQDRQS